jgi:hypothetical protein
MPSPETQGHQAKGWIARRETLRQDDRSTIVYRPPKSKAPQIFWRACCSKGSAGET